MPLLGTPNTIAPLTLFEYVPFGFPASSHHHKSLLQDHAPETVSQEHERLDCWRCPSIGPQRRDQCTGEIFDGLGRATTDQSRIVSVQYETRTGMIQGHSVS